MTTHQQAKEAAATLARYFDGSDSSINVTVPTADPPTQSTQSTIELPTDTTASMNQAYGPPIQPGTRGEGALEWYNWPGGSHPRLYSRTGSFLTDHDGDGRPDHRLHRDCVASFEAALQELWDNLGADEFEAQGLHVYCGGWAYRRKTGGTTWSTHSWGAAVDLNAPENPWKRNVTSFTPATLDTFERHGWLSGYRAWGHDAMHFQRAKFSHLTPHCHYARVGYPEWIKSI